MRPSQMSVAITRWRRVCTSDHSPPTRAWRTSSGSVSASASVSRHSASIVAQAARKSSAVVSRRSATRSGWRRSSSASTYAVTSTPSTTTVPSRPAKPETASGPSQSQPISRTPVSVHSCRRRAGQVGLPDGGAAEALGQAGLGPVLLHGHGPILVAGFADVKGSSRPGVARRASVDGRGLGDVGHGDPLPPAGGGRDQRGQAGPPLEPGGAHGPADHAAGGEHLAAPVEAARRRDQVGVGERVAQAAHPVRGERGRRRRQQHGRHQQPRRRGGEHDEQDQDRARRERPARARGSSGGVRARGPCPVRGTSTGAARPRTSRAAASTTASGAGRHQHRAARLPAQPGDDRVQPGAAGQPEPERLGEADAADPLLVEAGLPGREQPAASGARRAGCG